MTKIVKESISTVHFQIHGDYLTKLIRELWVEGNVKTCLDLCRDSGCPEEYWLDLITGKLKLEGVNELTLDYDNTTQVYGIPLNLNKSIERFKKEFKKARTEYVNASSRLNYYGFLMNIDGVDYKRNIPISNTKPYTKLRDSKIIEENQRIIKNLEPVFSYIYPKIGLDPTDIPEPDEEDIQEYDMEHPQLLQNMGKSKFDGDEYLKQKYEKINNEKYPVKNAEPVHTVYRKAESPKPIEIEYKILQDPWKGIIISNTDYDLTEKIPVKLGEDVAFIYQDKTYYTKRWDAKDREENGRPRKVTLKITTWKGTSIGAIHYYGKLVVEEPQIFMEGETNKNMRHNPHKQPDSINYPDIELHKITTQKEIDNDPARFTYLKAGDWTHGFYTQIAIKKRAQEIFDKFFGEQNGWKLIIEK